MLWLKPIQLALFLVSLLFPVTASAAPIILLCRGEITSISAEKPPESVRTYKFYWIEEGVFSDWYPNTVAWPGNHCAITGARCANSDTLLFASWPLGAGVTETVQINRQTGRVSDVSDYSLVGTNSFIGACEPSEDPAGNPGQRKF